MVFKNQQQLHVVIKVNLTHYSIASDVMAVFMHGTAIITTILSNAFRKALCYVSYPFLFANLQIE